MGTVSPLSFAKEVVLINSPVSEQDQRGKYPQELLKMALKKTEESYGSFQIQYAAKMQWERSKLMLEQGKLIHILQAATRPQWEKDLIPIRIPIMKGLLGNRIFLIKKQSQAKFSAINSLKAVSYTHLTLPTIYSV